MTATTTTSAGRGTLREVLRVALPLVMASSGHAIRLLADRIMLAHYSQDAIAAALPAGLTCFMLMSFFLGTAGYVNTFVAQYTGARRPARVGISVWQGLYLALFGGVLIALSADLVAGPIFKLMGHAPSVQREQVRYFTTLSRFSPAPIMLATLLAFWSGRGRTRVVMLIELACAVCNVVINYLLIFGRAGFPEMGMVGAGIGTGLSSLLGLIVAYTLFMLPANRRRFNTRPARTLDLKLLRRLVTYGAPNGLEFMLGLTAFNTFVAMVGRYGVSALEAANMAFGLNAVAFIPIIGLGMTASILVGQGIGAGRIDTARRAVRNSLLIALVYVGVMCAFFVFTPGIVLSVFARQGDVLQQEALDMARRCLRFIAAYLLFDATYITYNHAIKGAGDTRFAMIASISLAWGTLVLPCGVVLYLDGSVWTLWRILVAHVVLAAVVMYARYRSGKWEHMKVVEEHVVPSEIPGSAAAIELDRA